MELREKMRIIPDFPTQGISYKDITTILEDPEALQESVRVLSKALQGVAYDFILGVEARGFIFGAALAYAERKGFLMARKPGKLPGELIREDYALEYGDAAVELDKDSLPNGARVIVLDDLLATGGTAMAACTLVRKAGGEVAAVAFLTELTRLGGRKKLEEAGYKVVSVLTWEY